MVFQFLDNSPDSDFCCRFQMPKMHQETGCILLLKANDVFFFFFHFQTTLDLNWKHHEVKQEGICKELGKNISVRKGSNGTMAIYSIYPLNIQVPFIYTGWFQVLIGVLWGCTVWNIQILEWMSCVHFSKIQPYIFGIFRHSDLECKLSIKIKLWGLKDIWLHSMSVYRLSYQWELDWRGSLKRTSSVHLTSTYFQVNSVIYEPS